MLDCLLKYSFINDLDDQDQSIFFAEILYTLEKSNLEKKGDKDGVRLKTPS